MIVNKREVNQGENPDPLGSSSNKEDSPDDNSIDYWKERAKTFEEENNRLNEDNTNYRAAMKSRKSSKREVVIKEPSLYDREGVQNDDEEEDPQRAIVREELAKRDNQRRKDTLDSAVSAFIDKYPQYASENDFNDMNWNKLSPIIKRHAFVGDKEDMVRELEILHRGITQPLRPTTSEPKPNEVEDSGIGDVPPVPKGKDKVPSALTRPLNEYEQKAALAFKGGEAEYRKKLAESEG